MEFKASVQYGDFIGTSAADEADQRNLRDLLNALGFSREGELLIGITAFAGENHGAHKDPIYVEFMFAPKSDFDSVKAMLDASSGPVKLRVENTQMDLVAFMGLFKRFSVAFSRSGLLEGVEYTKA